MTSAVHPAAAALRKGVGADSSAERRTTRRAMKSARARLAAIAKSTAKNCARRPPLTRSTTFAVRSERKVVESLITAGAPSSAARHSEGENRPSVRRKRFFAKSPRWRATIVTATCRVSSNMARARLRVASTAS